MNCKQHAVALPPTPPDKKAIKRLRKRVPIHEEIAADTAEILNRIMHRGEFVDRGYALDFLAQWWLLIDAAKTIIGEIEEQPIADN